MHKINFLRIENHVKNVLQYDNDHVSPANSPPRPLSTS